MARPITPSIVNSHRKFIISLGDEFFAMSHSADFLLNALVRAFMNAGFSVAETPHAFIIMKAPIEVATEVIQNA